MAVKGIKGTDRRNYVLDLMRLSPRDFNYLSTNFSLDKISDENFKQLPEIVDVDFSCCLLRKELIDGYRAHLNMQKIKEE